MLTETRRRLRVPALVALAAVAVIAVARLVLPRVRTTKVHHPYLKGGVLGFSHQGEGTEQEKNTIAAFDRASEQGCVAIELDVWATLDGKAIVSHDDDIGGVHISELTYEQLVRTGIPVPTLEEVLRRYPRHRVNIDPKSNRAVKPAVDVVSKLDAWDRVCFGAFSDWRLHRVRRLSGGRACTSMGPVAVVIAWFSCHVLGWMPRLGADAIQVCPDLRQIKDVGSVPLLRALPVLTGPFMKAAREADLKVHAWTINGDAEMHRLIDLGVDGIMTDRWGVLTDVFGEQGLPLDGSRT